MTNSSPLPQPEPTPRQKAEIALALSLIPILRSWAKVCPRSKDAEPIDLDTVEIYAADLATLDTSPDELNLVARNMRLRTRFFPTIAEIAEYIRETRPTDRYRGYIDALDGNGFSCVAHPSCVLNGRLVERGKGNGVPAAPMAEYGDILEGIYDERERLGVDALTTLDNPDALTMRGVRALPRREPIGPDEEARLIHEARETRAAREGAR